MIKEKQEEYITKSLFQSELKDLKKEFQRSFKRFRLIINNDFKKSIHVLLEEFTHRLKGKGEGLEFMDEKFSRKHEDHKERLDNHEQRIVSLELQRVKKK